MVGYNLRFLESLKLFREEILRRSIGTILSVRAEVGQHLASWRSNIKYAESCNSKGMLDAEDVVGALIFLLSDQSTFINGQNIIIDDGWSL